MDTLQPRLGDCVPHQDLPGAKCTSSESFCDGKALAIS
jgi:hypothetical protein